MEGVWATIFICHLIFGGHLLNIPFKAYAADGSLVVTTNGTAHVQVFAVTGVCLYNAPVNGMTAIRNLPAGIYIVKAGNEVLKISVR